jgi:hypothetical protein
VGLEGDFFLSSEAVSAAGGASAISTSSLLMVDIFFDGVWRWCERGWDRIGLL